MLNGHVYPVADKMAWGTSYRQRPLLLHNKHGQGFDLVPAVRGSALALITSARGTAFGDLFNDGKIDVVVNNLDGTPSLFRNVTTDKHCWLAIKLIGGPGSPRDAVGATLLLETDGVKQRQDILSGGSFLSSNDQRAHFRLGKAKGNAKLTVRCPSGNTEKFTLTKLNALYTIAEGKGVLSIAGHDNRSEIGAWNNQSRRISGTRPARANPIPEVFPQRSIRLTYFL